jgi:hypothetical protein
LSTVSILIIVAAGLFLTTSFIKTTNFGKLGSEKTPGQNAGWPFRLHICLQIRLQIHPCEGNSLSQAQATS